MVILSSPSRWLFTKLIHLFLISLFLGNLNKETKLFCKLSQPGNIYFCDEGIAKLLAVETNGNDSNSQWSGRTTDANVLYLL